MGSAGSLRGCSNEVLLCSSFGCLGAPDLTMSWARARARAGCQAPTGAWSHSTHHPYCLSSHYHPSPPHKHQRPLFFKKNYQISIITLGSEQLFSTRTWRAIFCFCSRSEEGFVSVKPLLHFPALPVGQVTVITSPYTPFFLCQDRCRVCEFPLGIACAVRSQDAASARLPLGQRARRDEIAAETFYLQRWDLPTHHP